MNRGRYVHLEGRPLGEVSPPLAPEGAAPMNSTVQVANRISTLDQYSGSATLVGAGLGGALQSKGLARGYWHEPRPITIQSTVRGFNDSSIGVGNPRQFTWARVFLRISWGDGKQVFTQDVPAGIPYSVIGSYVEVSAYISNAPYVRNPGALNYVPNTVTADVFVALTDGEPPSFNKLLHTISYTTGRVVGDIIPGDNLITNVNQIIHSITGYHTAAADLWMMLFDSNTSMAANYGGAPNLAVLNGDTPLYQFKAQAGSNFSLEFPDGIVVQQGPCLLFSTTPETLTRVAGENGGTPIAGAPYAVNVQYEQPGVPGEYRFIAG